MNLALMRRHDRRDLRKNHTKTGTAKCRRESKFQLRKRGKIATLVISSGSTAAGERPRSGVPQSTMVAPESDGGRKRVAAIRPQALMNSERELVEVRPSVQIWRPLPPFAATAGSGKKSRRALVCERAPARKRVSRIERQYTRTRSGSPACRRPGFHRSTRPHTPAHRFPWRAPCGSRQGTETAQSRPPQFHSSGCARSPVERRACSRTYSLPMTRARPRSREERLQSKPQRIFEKGST